MRVMILIVALAGAASAEEYGGCGLDAWLGHADDLTRHPRQAVEPAGRQWAPTNPTSLPFGLQILRAAAPVAHALDYASTVQGLGRGLHEQAPLVGPIAYRPGWFALYKAGVALAADRAVVGLYRTEDQRRRLWALGMRPREWAWVLAGASVAVPGVVSVLNLRR